VADNALQEHWLGLPYLGCDEMLKTSQAWVKSGLLTTTVVIPANTGQALEMLAAGNDATGEDPHRTKKARVGSS
jgi:hypothetical protein